MPDYRNDSTALGHFLRNARESRDLSLRAVEESTGVSNAYLSQLEHGKIRQPSPTVLHKLSILYEGSYAEMLRLAGYPMPETGGAGNVTRAADVFARFGGITVEEEAALTEYLAFLRARRKRGGR